MSSSTDCCDGWRLPTFLSFGAFGSCFHLVELTQLFQVLQRGFESVLQAVLQDPPFAFTLGVFGIGNAFQGGVQEAQANHHRHLCQATGKAERVSQPWPLLSHPHCPQPWAAQAAAVSSSSGGCVPKGPLHKAPQCQCLPGAAVHWMPRKHLGCAALSLATAHLVLTEHFDFASTLICLMSILSWSRRY